MFATSPDASAKICGGCNEQISGPSIAAGGKYYHMEHLRCSVCKRGLAGATLFEKDGNLYCENDYHELYSPKCAYCSESILDRCISALGKHFHPEHFFCSQCGKEFGTNGFLEHEGKAYCEEDYFNLFAPVCGNPKCEKPIMADTINALGKTWHPGCFVCGECSSPFTNGTFFDYDNIPYCETHYHAKKGSICPACTKPIVGRCITALNKKWHPEHFACGFCQKVLGKIPFKEASDKPFCIPCFTRLYG
ncbi:LIM domain protein [Paraphysoderma sedebokerense]|nr:LIM domain protein [Paraphysoderma sedebokerense]